jgi:hypothetical protein
MNHLTDFELEINITALRFSPFFLVYSDCQQAYKQSMKVTLPTPPPNSVEIMNAWIYLTPHTPSWSDNQSMCLLSACLVTLLFDSKDGGNAFFRNVDNTVP